MDETVYKIAIAGFLHDIGKFAERATGKRDESKGIKPAFYVDEEFLTNNMDLYQPHYKGIYTHKHAVYTAAFIDHIEKFLPDKFNKGEWGLGDSFMNLTAKHHKPETPFQWIIAIADRISSGFEREREFEDYNKEINVRDYKKTRLLTIFEGISIDDNWKNSNLESYRFRYPLKELSPDTIFPEDSEEYRALDSEEASREYNELFFNFVDSLERLEHKKQIPLWFEHFDSLFMIYASNIPAATVGRVIPDISLYDHSKTTAALASAIYLYHNQTETMEIERIKDYEEKKFLIITGDFYGIQNFIFSEGGSTNKASAKLLRGRSFAVSLISELAADMLCREIGLTPISIILNAAGKFTIIAPNTKESMDKIRKIEEEINEWLINIFYGECTMGISCIEASPNDFVADKFTDLWEKLARESEKKKYNKINLEKYGGEIEGYLDHFNDDLNKKLCPFCGKRPSSPEIENDPLLVDEKSSCKICRDHIYIGTNLVKADRIAIATVDADIYGDKLKEPIFGKYQVTMDVEGKLSKLADEGILLKYWDISISREGNIEKEITAKFINGYVPIYDESDLQDNRYLAGRKSEQKKLELIEHIKIDKDNKIPKTFSHIALKALDKYEERGIEALGILKADVDNLGLIFARGIKSYNISRLATLSRQMNHYFTIYIPYILSTKEEFKNIYTVFAGGDDLFLIGPWNRIIDFSEFLNDKFRSYTCNNPDITISAGIYVNKPDLPIPTLAKKSEDALDKAKSSGRDRITIFDEPVKWETFCKLKDIKKTLQKWIDKSIINNSMLYRFNEFLNMVRKEKNIKDLKFNIRIEDMECFKWHARFKYTIVRNIGKELKGEERQKAIDEVLESALWLETYYSAFKIPLWQVIYNNRRQKGGIYGNQILER